MTPAPTRRPDDDLDALLALAREVAGEAAAILRDARHGPLDVATKSSLTDMVSDADRASEAWIASRLRAARPRDGLLGEEGARHDGESGIEWIVDPLDGTTNFLYDFAPYAVSIGVASGGRPVAGVVHDVARDEVFAAAEGRGATRNGAPVRVSSLAELSSALIGTGFGYDAAVRRAQAERLVRVLPRVRDVRRAGAASVDLCAVACGRLDGYYESGLQPWDMAAGVVIVREAGGLVGDYDAALRGEAPLVAAAPAIFDALRALVLG